MFGDRALELLSTRELLQLPPPKWLIDSLIPEGGFVGLYGPPGSGKSFLALDWAMSISEGRPWLGKYVTKQAPVIYVAAEGGRGIQKRARAWMTHYGYTDLPAMYWLLNPLYVREEGIVEDFLETLEEEGIWPGMLVLDTLSRSFGGGEENASEDMGHFVDRLTALAQGRYMASLVVHHTNAQGSRERGHTAFRGAADAMFSCTAERTSAFNTIARVTVANDKQKDDKEADTIYLQPVEGKSSLIFEEGTPPPAKERGSGVPAIMRKADMLTLLASHSEGLTFNEWLLASGVPKATFKRRLRILTADNEIYKDERLYFAMPAVTDLAALDERDE